MKLANNETVLKSWNYANAKQGFTKSQAEIKLTNKRLISSVESKRSSSQIEVPLENIKGFSFSVDNASNLKAILLIFLGIITAVVIVGIGLIILGVQSLNQGAFAMSICVEGHPVDAASADSRRNVKKSGKIKVKIDRTLTQEIADSLGAQLLNLKSGVAV